MNQTVNFECIDGDDPRFPRIVLDYTMGVEELVLPSIGEKVGIWQMDPNDKHGSAFFLHYVVDVRHYIFPDKHVVGQWQQDTHILLSSRGPR